MVFRIEGIPFPFFYDHSLVIEKCSYLDRLVVAKFYILQSVTLFQAFQILIVTADVAIGKSGIQCSAMYTLRNFPVRIERLFDWSPDLLFFGQIRLYRFSNTSSFMRKAKGSNSRSRICTASTTLMFLSSLSTSTCMIVSALLLSSVPMCPRACSSFLF